MCSVIVLKQEGLLTAIKLGSLNTKKIYNYSILFFNFLISRNINTKKFKTTTRFCFIFFTK